MKVKMPALDFNTPSLSQRLFCTAAGFDMASANDWISRGIIEVDETEGWRVKGGRRFSLGTAWRTRILKEMVEDYKMPLARAAEVAELAERLAVKGGHLQHWMTWLEAGKSFIPAFLVVAWSGDCYDGKIITGDKYGWPNFSSAEEVPERFFNRPFLVVPLSNLFESVWRKCSAMLTPDEKT